MASPLNRIASLVPSFNPFPRAVSTSPPVVTTSRRSRPELDEKVPSRAGIGDIAGRVWFLPYGDSNSTRDTTEIRSAMRLMLRDPYVKAGWLSQVLTVLAQPFQIHPPKGDKSKASQDQADFIRHCLENVDGEMVGVGQSILMNLGSDGMSLAEKVWQIEPRGKYANKQTLRALKPKDPDEVRLIGDRFNNVTGVKATRTSDTYPITDFTYVRYLHTFDEPFGMAAFRSSYGSYWMRDTVRKLRIIHKEKMMDGLLMGTFSDPADKPALEAALQRARTSTWLSVPEGVRVESLAKSQASESDYKSFDDSLCQEILIGVALSHLHILQGAQSDQGNTSVHKSVADLATWLLTYLVQLVVNRQIIPDLIDYNYPVVTEYPRVTLGGVTNDEILQTLQIMEGSQRAGFKPSRSYYATELTIQEADPNDPTDQLTPPAPPPVPGLPGVGGGGGAAGGGAVQFSEPKAPVVNITVPTPVVHVAAPSVTVRAFAEDRGPPGPAPRPGLAWKEETQRWVREDGTDEPGQDGTTPTPSPSPPASTSPAPISLTSSPGSRNKIGDIEQVATTRSGGTPVLSGDRAVEFARSSELDRKLSPDESKAIDTFKSSSAMNRYNRGQLGVERPDLDKVNAVLDSAIASQKPLSAPVTLFRAVDHTGFQGTLKPGAIIADGAHLSTSIDAGYAATALGGDFAENTMVQVRVPKGAKALYVDQPGGRHEHEREVLLPRGGKYRVVSVEPMGKGKYAVVDYLPDEAKSTTGSPSPPVPVGGKKPVTVTFAELPHAHDEIALAGKDGKRATELMSAAKATGRDVLARLTEQAVGRLLTEPNPLAASVLFSDDELKEIADSLSATNATADLLGRARVRRMAEQANATGGVRTFAESSGDAFDVFEEAPPALSPNRAADYFQKLVPSIGVDPQRFGPLFDRHAFTLAHAADQVLLEQVKSIIQDQLSAGTRPEAIADIQETLDKAGVTVKNPSYAEMVMRTNMNDSYLQGFSAEMADPVMRETFPAWQYVGIRDGRQGKDHEQRFDKYYPATASFAEVRGNRPFNCLLPGSYVQGRFTAALKARYSGEAVEIVTGKGHRLSITPNHPVLTERGFIPAGDLAPGQRLLNYLWEGQRSVLVADEENSPALVEDVFEAFNRLADQQRMESATAFDLNGDERSIKGDVEVVRPNRQLLSHLHTRTREGGSESGFTWPSVGELGLPSGGATNLNVDAVLLPATGAVSSTDLSLPSGGGHLRPLQSFGFTRPTDGDASLNQSNADDTTADLERLRHLILRLARNVSADEISSGISGEGARPQRLGYAANVDALRPQPVGNGVPLDAEFAAQLLSRFAGCVSIDEVSHVRRFHYDGPVYDMETDVGYFVADSDIVSGGIVISNCRCSAIPVTKYELDDLQKRGVKVEERW